MLFSQAEVLPLLLPTGLAQVLVWSSPGMMHSSKSFANVQQTRLSPHTTHTCMHARAMAVTVIACHHPLHATRPDHAAVMPRPALPCPAPAAASASHRRISLIAGGTGITPCWQIIRTVTDDPEDDTQVQAAGWRAVSGLVLPEL